MKISYAITVCNEFAEVKRLISLLQAIKRDEDEIVVLFDKGKCLPTTDIGILMAVPPKPIPINRPM